MNRLAPETEKLRVANCVIRPDGNSVASGTINWAIVNDTAYGSDFFSSPSAMGSFVGLKLPDNILIHAMHVTPDKNLMSKGVMPAVVSTDKMHSPIVQVAFYQYRGLQIGYIQGAGSSWTKIGDVANFTTVTNNASSFTFNLPQQFNADGIFVIASYVGSTLDRRVAKLLSGLGAANFGYQVQVASTGSAVGSNSSNDVVEIATGSYKTVQVNPNLNDSVATEGAIFTSDCEVHVSVYYQIIDNV